MGDILCRLIQLLAKQFKFPILLHCIMYCTIYCPMYGADAMTIQSDLHRFTHFITVVLCSLRPLAHVGDLPKNLFPKKLSLNWKVLRIAGLSIICEVDNKMKKLLVLT